MLMTSDKPGRPMHERAFVLFDRFHLTCAEIEQQMGLAKGEGKALIIKCWQLEKYLRKGGA